MAAVRNTRRNENMINTALLVKMLRETMTRSVAVNPGIHKTSPKKKVKKETAKEKNSSMSALESKNGLAQMCSDRLIAMSKRPCILKQVGKTKLNNNRPQKFIDYLHILYRMCLQANIFLPKYCDSNE